MDKMNQRRNIAASETTYHSFNDIELFEPASPPRKPTYTNTNRPNSSEDERPPNATAMKRQDSGYESRNTTPRNSISHSSTRPSPPPGRRTSTSTASAGPRPRAQTRPSTRRSTKSYHHPNSSSVHVVRPPTSAPVVVQSSYFQFPSPDPEDDIAKHRDEHNVTPAAPPVPPQPTHYWTSDRTRRLEYAAIDAAQRGFKGWIRRNLLPDCITAKDARHIPFDDDTGSVRRYRLDLEDDDEKSVAAHKRKTWHFWS